MKFHKLLFVALAMIAAIGCNTNEEGEIVYGSVFTVSVDKDTIEANGVDYATFTVKDENGNDLTADPSISSKIYFVNEETGEYLDRKVRTFTSITNGVYKFYATVKGAKTENTATVTVQNRAKYEKYAQKVCIYQCTGTWCGYCPLMTEALNKVRNGKYGENVIVLACHGSSPNATDPYALPLSDGNDLGNWLGGRYGAPGFPYAVYDLAFGYGESAASAINSYLHAFMVKYPSNCGVKIAKAQINADGTGVIEASIKADKAGTFDIAWAVLADNQPSNGGMEDIYHDVVQAVSSNFLGMSDESKVTLEAGEEYSKTFNISVPAFGGIEFNPANCKVVVLAHNEQMVDNANICAAGSSVEYAVNE